MRLKALFIGFFFLSIIPGCGGDSGGQAAVPVDGASQSEAQPSDLAALLNADCAARCVEHNTWEDNHGYWIPRGWAKEAPIKIASRIDVPRSGQVSAGTQPVAGVAWSPTSGIARVEISVDDGPWEPCELGETASGEAWVQWFFRWAAQPGQHTIVTRAIGIDGTVQPSVRVGPAPDGAEGHHSVSIMVT